jgi:hypothetical protein
MSYHPLLGEKKSPVSSGLWIILLEAGLALALFVFIVWWTLPRNRRDRDDGPDHS